VFVSGPTAVLALDSTILLEESRESSDYSNVSPWKKDRLTPDWSGSGPLVDRLPVGGRQIEHPPVGAGSWNTRILVGVVLVAPEPLRRLGIILMIIGTAWIVGITVALSR
jgi:hypothetical protein